MKTLFTLIILITGQQLILAQDFKKDVFETSKGPLEIYFIGHGTLMFKFDGKIIHVDPTSGQADYSKMPKADLILVTHHHGDHCDASAINPVKTTETIILVTKLAKDKLGEGTLMENGDKFEYNSDIRVEAIPAYNLVHKRDNGEAFHPKGTCNSYVITIADKKIFIGGDTENTPEMKALKGIDIAFLPMNLPYTMTPEMVADGAKGMRPKILYPYHYGDTDTNIIVGLMKNEKDIEVRIRPMK